MAQTWNGNLLHDAGNVVSAIGGFLSGPPGDPGRIRQVAAQIEALRDRFEADRRALDEAVDELTRTWTGDGARSFAATWYQGGQNRAPALVLSDVTTKLDGFVHGLRDYADKLEHSQHEHWIQMGIMAALTVVNAAQLGMDPASDAAEIGAGAADEVGSSFGLADLGTFALQGAAKGFAGDVVSQLGADVWDHLDTQFDQTGDDAVGLFNAEELALSTVRGGATGVVLGGGGQVVKSLRDSFSRDSVDAGAPPGAPVIGAGPHAAIGEAGSIRDVNPLGGTQNCVNCVVASDATLAGAPAVALDSLGPQPISILEKAFGGTFQPVSGEAELRTMLVDAGPGSRAIVYGGRSGGVGHVFNAVNQGGVIRFLDGQIGGPASFSGYSDVYLLWTNKP